MARGTHGDASAAHWILALAVIFASLGSSVSRADVIASRAIAVANDTSPVGADARCVTAFADGTAPGAIARSVTVISEGALTYVTPTISLINEALPPNAATRSIAVLNSLFVAVSDALSPSLAVWNDAGKPNAVAREIQVFTDLNFVTFNLDLRPLGRRGLFRPDLGMRPLVKVSGQDAARLVDANGDSVWSASLPLHPHSLVQWQFAIAPDSTNQDTLKWVFERPGNPRSGVVTTGTDTSLATVLFDDAAAPSGSRPGASWVVAFPVGTSAPQEFGSGSLTTYATLSVDSLSVPSLIAIQLYPTQAPGLGYIPGIAQSATTYYWSIEATPSVATFASRVSFPYEPLLSKVEEPGALRLVASTGGAEWRQAPGAVNEGAGVISARFDRAASSVHRSVTVGSASMHNEFPGAAPVVLYVFSGSFFGQHMGTFPFGVTEGFSLAKTFDYSEYFTNAHYSVRAIGAGNQLHITHDVIMDWPNTLWLGYPWMAGSLSVDAYVRGPAGTPFSVVGTSHADASIFSSNDCGAPNGQGPLVNVAVSGIQGGVFSDCNSSNSWNSSTAFPAFGMSGATSGASHPFAQSPGVEYHFAYSVGHAASISMNNGTNEHDAASASGRGVLDLITYLGNPSGCVGPFVPCPRISFNLKEGSEEWFDSGHMNMTLCGPTGHEYTFGLWSHGALPLVGPAIISGEDPNRWDSRVIFPITAQQFDAVLQTVLDFNSNMPTTAFNTFASDDDAYMNCTKFAAVVARALHIQIADYMKMPSGWYDPRTLGNELNSIGDGGCLAGGYVELNHRSRRGSVSGKAASFAGPVDFSPIRTTEVLQVHSREMAADLSLPFVESHAGGVVCGRGKLVSVRLTGPGRDECFASVGFETGIVEASNGLTYYHRAEPGPNGTTDSCKVVFVTKGKVYELHFPISVVEGGSGLTLEVPIPRDSASAVLNGPFTPFDPYAQLDVPGGEPVDSRGDSGIALQVIPAPGGQMWRIVFRPDISGETRIVILDVAGRLVRGWELGVGVAGKEVHVAWDDRNEQGARVRSGIYFVRAESGPHVAFAKMVVVR